MTVATDVNRLTAEEAKARHDRGEPLLFVDARSPESWGKSEETLAGSVRIDPHQITSEALAAVPHGRSIVTFCT
jgi:hypothetical protein